MAIAVYVHPQVYEIWDSPESFQKFAGMVAAPPGH